MDLSRALIRKGVGDVGVLGGVEEARSGGRVPSCGAGYLSQRYTGSEVVCRVTKTLTKQTQFTLHSTGLTFT